MYDYIHYSSPLGMLTIAAEEGGLTALVIEGQKHAERHLTGNGREFENPVLLQTALWLDRYFSGGNPSPMVLPLAPKGTAFQQHVWQVLLDIPYGKTATYSFVAHRLASSARAVGNAIGRNPICIIIPCHRILGSNGSLTGYAGGLENKRKLLQLEGIFDSHGCKSE